MGMAEEAIRRREANARAAKQAAQQATERAATARAESLMREIRAEAPLALERLRSQGYPGGHIVCVPRRGIGRILSGSTDMAGWPIQTLDGEGSVGEYCVHTYLLSDGSIQWVDISSWRGLSGDRSLEGALSNLRRLGTG